MGRSRGIAGGVLQVARWIDFRFRWLDLHLNRTDEGGWWQRQFPVAPGHPPLLVLVGLGSLLAVTHGPLLFRWRGPGAFLVALVAVALLVGLLHWAKGRAAPKPWFGTRGPWSWLLLSPWLVLLVLVIAGFFWESELPGNLGFYLVGLGVLFGLLGALGAPRGASALVAWLVFLAAAALTWYVLATPEATQAEGGVPYRHALTPAGLLVLFFGLPFSRWWAAFVFRDHDADYKKAFAPYLKQTKLFDPRIPSRAKLSDIVRAFWLVLVNTPFQLLLLPCLAVVLARPEQLTPLNVGFLFALSWVLMAMVVFHSRLDAVLGLINRLFVEGASLVLSILVVSLAAARIAEVGYVTTVLDGAAGRSLAQFLAASYALSWMYDYGSRRAMCDALLGFLRSNGDPADRASYEPPGGQDSLPCWIQPHGGSRLLVMRDLGPGKDPHFNAYRPLDLFREIAARAPTQSPPRRRIAMLMAQTRFYRTFPGLLCVVALLWGASQLLGRTRLAHIAAVQTPASAAGAFDLPGVLGDLRNEYRHEDPLDVYLVAASGGGTRAALHTHTVLRALAERGALRRVAMISSVSGGSLATAWFAHRRADLVSRDSEVRRRAWQAFHAAVTADHFERVLGGLTEWRLVVEGRLGTLLRESFDDHMQGGRTRLGECSDVGLVFNTAVVGDAPAADTPPERTAGAHAGTRLVFTNIRGFTGASAHQAPPAYDPDLRYVNFHDPRIPLAAAASASANFPPVFSNLPVDALLEGSVTRRYWVTDGGAVENRGLVSLLLALRAVLQGWDAPGEDLPTFHVLVADASAYKPSFRQDRGLGAISGARLQLGNKLVAALFREVQGIHFDRSQREGGVRIHDLTLPRAIRCGMGTHWTLPKTVKLDPVEWLDGARAQGDVEPVELDQDALLRCFEQLFRAGERSWPDPRIETWIREDDPRRVLMELPGTR